MASTLEGERFTISAETPIEELFDVDYTELYMTNAGLAADQPGMESGVLTGLGRALTFAMTSFPVFEDATQSSLLPESSDPPFPPVYPYFFSTDLVYGREHMNTVLRFVRGDTYTFTIVVLLDGEFYNLTPVALKMTAKWTLDDVDADAVFQKTIGDGITLTDPTVGEAQIIIQPADTTSLPADLSTLVYDIEMTDGSAVYTVARGELNIVSDVTIGA